MKIDEMKLFSRHTDHPIIYYRRIDGNVIVDKDIYVEHEKPEQVKLTTMTTNYIPHYTYKIIDDDFNVEINHRTDMVANGSFIINNDEPSEYVLNFYNESNDILNIKCGVDVNSPLWYKDLLSFCLEKRIDRVIFVEKHGKESVIFLDNAFIDELKSCINVCGTKILHDIPAVDLPEIDDKNIIMKYNNILRQELNSCICGNCL